MIIAHVQNDTLVRTYTEGKGRVTLATGDTVSPPVAGYVNGVDRIVPLVEETIDTSTTQNTVRSETTTVEADRVVKAITIRDKTQAEIDADAAAEEAAELGRSDRYGILRALARATFNQENRIRQATGQQPITAQQFRDWIKAQL